MIAGELMSPNNAVSTNWNLTVELSIFFSLSGSFETILVKKKKPTTIIRDLAKKRIPGNNVRSVHLILIP